MANQQPSPATRFKPGQSGNPAGGSRKASLRSLIRKAMAKAADDGSTALEQWVARLLVDPDANEHVIEVLKLTDGDRPADDPTEREDEREHKPQIVIPPIAPLDEGGQPVEGGL